MEATPTLARKNFSKEGLGATQETHRNVGGGAMVKAHVLNSWVQWWSWSTQTSDITLTTRRIWPLAFTHQKAGDTGREVKFQTMHMMVVD